MILYKKVLLLISLATVVNATTLKEIIFSTLENNNNIKASMIENQAKQKSFNSVENIYNPTATIGVNYSRLDLDTREVQVGATTNGFFKIGLNLYDGGKNQAIKNQKNHEYKASVLNTITTKKETVLQVVTLFFQIKTVTDSIKVFEEKSETLKAQYERMQIKYDIKMATIDEVLKFKSEYETNQYIVQDLKYQKINLLQNISLLSDIDVKNLDNSTLPEIQNILFKDSENIEALKIGIKAIDESINIASSVNRPQLSLNNSLNIYDYSDYNEKVLTDLPDKQNQLTLSLTYNLYDSISKDKIESVRLEKMIAKEKLTFLKKQEKINFELSKKKLATQQLKIDSLKSAVEMGQSVYDIVKIKYQNGIVDNITYLDALSKNTYNQALYKQALNDYEIAKANYYFSSGIDYKTILK